MQLKKFDYSEFEGQPTAWSVSGLILGNINLLVGKNATGKSNTLAKIAQLGNILAGECEQPAETHYNAEFSENNPEQLAKWGKGLIMHAFNAKQKQDVIDLYVKGEQEFGQNFKEQIVSFMKEIGYELLEVGSSHSTIYVKEKHVETKISLGRMSQGMYRAISLIIQISYNTLKNLPTTVIIDDIGEGLDFARSSSLIGLLSRVAEEGKFQLIMSTNDRYVMNNVPLKYWQVIQRTGGACKVYNYHNTKQKFDEFQYTGLNNFDFLATDFINS